MSAALALPEARLHFQHVARDTDNNGQETAGKCIYASYINLNLLQL